MKESPARHGIGPQVMSMEFRPASAAVLGEGDFLRAFSKAGYKNAQSLYTQMTAQSPEFKLSPVKLNTLGYQLPATSYQLPATSYQLPATSYQLPGAKDARGAAELFKLATTIEPKYGNAFDSEGEAYEALGECHRGL
jgi:hypothetical protein